ncbi:TPA: hypothetical protein ACS7ZY_003324 [Providencia alcalifaciens]
MDVIEFKQNDIINYINLPENKALFTKVAQVYGVDFSSSEGFCYGISHEFMRYAHNNKGDEYISNINNLLSIIAESGEELSEVAKVKLQATQQHAKSLLNNYIIKMIYTQSINNKIGEINVRYHNLKYPEKLIGKNIRKEIESIIDFNQLNSDFNLSDQGRDYTHQFNDYVAKMSKITLDKYMDAIFSEDDFFNTEEGIRLSKDALFKEIYNKFKGRVSSLNDNYDIKDIKFIFNIIYQDIVRQEIFKLENYAKINGLTTIGSHETKLNYRKVLTFEIELHKFISHLTYHVKNERTPFIYSFSSWNHAMSTNITFDESNERWVYRFFDPNEGVVKYYDLKKFSSFLHNFVDIYQDIYKFRRTKDGEYTVLLLDFTSNKKI